MAEIRFTFIGQAEDIDELLNDLFESEGIGTGTQKSIPGGATITMGRTLMRKGFNFPRDAEIVLSFGRDVAVIVVGSYIYGKWKNRKGGKMSMKMRHREVDFDKGEIIKAIEDEIAIQAKEE